MLVWILAFVVDCRIHSFLRGGTSVTVLRRVLMLSVRQDLEGQVAGQGEGMQELAGRTHQLVEENEQVSSVTDDGRILPGQPGGRMEGGGGGGLMLVDFGAARLIDFGACEGERATMEYMFLRVLDQG